MLSLMFNLIHVMKKLILILFSIFSLPIYADHYLVIELNDPKQHSYSLEDKPVITFDNNILLIKTDKIELDYPISNIIKYYFTQKGDTGINNINGDTNNIHFNYTNNDFILIEGIASEDKVGVYEINGKSCLVDIEIDDNNVRVELKKLPKGIYLIKVNNHSFKLIR